jgi:RibD C-terminal domain
MAAAAPEQLTRYQITERSRASRRLWTGPGRRPINIPNGPGARPAATTSQSLKQVKSSAPTGRREEAWHDLADGLDLAGSGGGGGARGCEQGVQVVCGFQGRRLGRRDQQDGSASLVRSLHAAALIDRYTLLICPLTLGSGTRLFEDSAPPAEFDLTSSVTTPKGVIIAQYTRR